MKGMGYNAKSSKKMMESANMGKKKKSVGMTVVMGMDMKPKKPIKNKKKY